MHRFLRLFFFRWNSIRNSAVSHIYVFVEILTMLNNNMYMLNNENATNFGIRVIANEIVYDAAGYLKTKLN